MKSASSLVLAGVVTLAVLSTSPAAASETVDSSRFLAEKEALKQELDAWKRSAAGQYAKRHGLYDEPKGTLQNASAVLDDQLRRLHLTKLHIEQAQRANPDAVFSVDSPFTLMTDAEFTKFIGSSFRRDADVFSAFKPSNSSGSGADDAEVPVAPLADKDWTASGCVAPVKQQGQCGSCWAFAAIAALESAYCLQGHELTTFSEQQVLSCDQASHGCDGGFPADGLQYVQQQGGVCRESDYAYESGQSGVAGQCGASSCSPVQLSIREVKSVPQSDAGLVAAVQQQPVAVGVAAGNPTWKQYKSGVVSTCASTQLDHAVVVVGVGGSGSATPFFKIRNSWGTAWGEQGYIRLKRGVAGAGTCGVIGPKSVVPML
ncbi:hypothetical protein P43SY_002445 [Pythium insidiosum]|uniref:Peptidase C1A papain C-terminal domain-containing protein n=1 Tax=Pythium insidiosum TaxID=114742 RepID=A0AAD5LJM0_PYTIN|nr:hypothetical protein P43SY_002445 [Pythium insidiosum]